MANEVASTIIQLSWIEEPEKTIGVTVSQPIIGAHNGVIPLTFVYADLYAGGERITPSGIGPLTTIDEQGKVNAETGLTWNFLTGTAGRIGYRISATELKKDITLSSYVTYEDEQYPFSIQFMRVDDGKDGIGEPGEDGKNGVWVPPLMLWTDYPTNPLYQFQAGVPGTDTRLDIVGVLETDGSITPYRCRVTHTKSALHNPSTDNTSKKTLAQNPFWQVCDSGVWKLLATELLLASNARVDFLSGQAIRIGNGADVCGFFGAPLPSGAILYTGGSDESKATFVVYKEGRARWGDASGKRIELDPMSGRMLVYDADGKLCAIHSGEMIDYSKVGQETGSGASSTVEASAMKAEVSGSGSTTKELVSGTAPDKDGTLKVELPNFSIESTGSLLAGDTIMSMWKAELYLQVLINGVQKTSPMLLCVDENKTTASTDKTQTISVNVPALSTYKVQLLCKGNLSSGGKSTFTALGKAILSLEVANNVCHYGKNGWYISSSNQNYAYCLMDADGKMHFKVVSGGTVKVNTD